MVSNTYTNDDKPWQLGQQLKFNKFIAPVIMRREKNEHAFILSAINIYIYGKDH
jgi:hypothetical protein